MNLEKINNIDELEEHFDPGSLQRGKEYFRDGRVLEHATKVLPDHEVITGRVQGSGSRIYETYIILEASFNQVAVDGDCTCPVGFNCKHVVAALMEHLSKRRSARASAGGMLADNDRLERAAIDTWLEKIHKSAQSQSGNDYPPDQPMRIVYLLEPVSHPYHGERIAIRPLSCRALKRGGYGKAAPFSVERVWQPYPPTYVLPIDRAILRSLVPEPYSTTSISYWLEGLSGSQILQHLMDSGRCHWRDKDSQPLVRGESRPAQPRWLFLDDARWRFVFESIPPADVIFPVSPPWYLDHAAGCCGELETGIEPALAGALTTCPTMSHQAITGLAARLKKELPDLPLPEPETVRVQETRGHKAIPRLRLMQHEFDLDNDGPFSMFPQTVSFTVGRLSFRYDAHSINYAETNDAPIIKTGKDICRIHRNRKAEESAAQRLQEMGLNPISEVVYHCPPGGEGDFTDFEDPEHRMAFWLDFQRGAVPLLTDAGWEIEVDESFPYHLVTPDDWWGEFEEESGNDWFNLELGVMVGDTPVSLLGPLLQWLQTSGSRAATLLGEAPQDAEFRLTLEDGRILTLPGDRVRGILGTLLELYDPDTRLDDGRLRLSSRRAGLLQDLEEGHNQWRWHGAERLKELSQRLQAFNGLEDIPVPQNFNADLRPYQRDGLAWLQFLREYEFGGILADDMGLGKTVQTLAHLLTEKQAGRADIPSLVVAPTSLMSNWRIEAQRFAPELSVLTLHGPDRKHHFERMAEHDLLLTTYPLLARDMETLSDQPLHLLILDEAQNIKNPRAKATLALRRLQARHRLCLTGTPMENHLGELWSLFDFLQPGLLGDQRQFRRLFRTPIEKHADGDRQASLNRRVAPFLLRRSKDAVAAELPAKTEVVREAGLLGAQRDLYESIRVAMHEKIRKIVHQKGLARSHIEILDALLKLRQICCDPRLVKLERAKKVTESAKLRLLMDMLPEMVEEGRRILLFSQFTTMLGLIEQELSARDIDYVKLTGRTRDRESPIRRFQDGEVPLFLISLKAGGTGLNLTAADTVIHYDPWWNPAVENQATDRAHRIGQDKPVFVYRLITVGTVEEKILRLQQHKKNLSDALFSGSDAGSHSLRAEDLEILFQPLEDGS